MYVTKSMGLRVLALALMAAVGSGCGGGGKGSGSSNANPPPSSGNASPTIQGQAGGSVVAGQSYSFQPTASDPDGDQLTFSAANVPSWASFNASTGRLSGTPTVADVARYSGITITVSDGRASASLSPFAVDVLAMGTGRATLTWVPPTGKTDGTVLTDLAGYEVVYGRSATELDQYIRLNNPSLNSYVVENLGAGTWYFAVTAVASSGSVSSISNVASKTIT